MHKLADFGAFGCIGYSNYALSVTPIERLGGNSVLKEMDGN